jgi:hypothetical protein
MRTWLTRTAIVVAAGLTMAAAWERLSGFSSNQFLFYPVLLFPYALFALTTRQEGRHLPALFAGMAGLAGLWLWVLVQAPASGGPSLVFAVVAHLIASTVLGVLVTRLGRRRRPSRTPL